MSHPQPPQRQPTTPETQRYIQTMHNAAIFMTIVCPILTLLPPRKFINTAALLGMTTFSTNYLVREQTGRSIWQHISGRPGVSTASEVAVWNNHVGPGTANDDEGRKREEMARLGEEGLDQYRGRARWKVQREKEIREEIEEGKGIFDMITGQIWDVWRQGKKEDEDEGEKE